MNVFTWNTTWIAVALVFVNGLIETIPQLTVAWPNIGPYANVAIAVLALVAKSLQVTLAQQSKEHR